MPGKKKKIKPVHTRKSKNDREKVSVKEKFTRMLELPREIVLDVPKITMIGNNYMVVENYKGVMEYDDVKIRLNTGKGIIVIEGKKLSIKEITSEEIYVEGNVANVQFLL